MTIEATFLSLPFWTGLFAVMCFAWSRFNVTLTDIDELSPPLHPRTFTTAFRFFLAAGVYMCGYAMIYVVLLLFGTLSPFQDFLKEAFGRALAAVPGADKEAVGTPTWAALVATAVLPSFCGPIDRFARNFLQDFASIPGKARALAREVLSALEKPEPASPSNADSLGDLLVALKAHQARFDRLEKIWIELEQQAEQDVAGRRYRKFREANQKIMEGFSQEFASNPENWKTAESARYVERRQRREMPKVARFIMCAMLEAERTELRVRARLNKLGIPVLTIGIDFGPSQIVLSVVCIYVMALIGCGLSVIAYHLIYGADWGLRELFQVKGKEFAIWSLLWVVTYLLTVLFAAGVSMKIIDRTNDDGALRQPTDRVIDIASTYIGAAVVAFFPILIARVAEGKPTSAYLLVDVVPWVIGPASLATVFVWLSTSSQGISDKPATAIAYVLLHATVALVGSTLALLLWLGLGGQLDPKTPQLTFFLIPIVSGCVGAAIGLVLSSTRLQRPAPALARTGSG